MEIRGVTLDEVPWALQHGEILAFVRKYGSGHVSSAVLRGLLRLTPSDLNRPGCSLLVARIRAEDGERLAGVACAMDYGRTLCVVVVHPLYRGRGIGARLLQAQLTRLGQLSCRVALSQVPGLHMCFRAGLYASGLTRDPHGKALLLLESQPVLPNIEEPSAHNSKEGDMVVTPRPGHPDLVPQ
ncbi:MAG: GNAT family N-acetyltransferase [Paenibacillaceae bacterium]|uniref:GNAT family N-acetyltransferase n=1 Tax=Paenibacillus mellifer TaxID=2937794 RepID=A0A9X1Y1R7_9BACL|nr:GNAT family N-acetyltransferase [Paenibacillus mellifer]MBW4840250.1 GNAT family N-acetyltransferase [Paenibacillaceae bacterium]MCK8489795.1 GNAT family N-acetyltransferase [Paenibacillus mellifer]